MTRKEVPLPIEKHVTSYGREYLLMQAAVGTGVSVEPFKVLPEEPLAPKRTIVNISLAGNHEVFWSNVAKRTLAELQTKKPGR